MFDTIVEALIRFLSLSSNMTQQQLANLRLVIGFVGLVLLPCVALFVTNVIRDMRRHR